MTLLFLVCFTMTAWAQNFEKPKVKIVLMGTVHFEPSTIDMFKNKELTIKSEKRQREVKQVVDKITALKPDQICIEYPKSDQEKMDDVYKRYLKGDYVLDGSEIDQLALRAAKKLNLEKLTCVNYYGRFDSDSMMRFAQENDQMELANSIGERGNTMITEINEVLENQTIANLLNVINSKEMMNRNLSFYTQICAKIGKGTNYVGTNLAADWYSTNLHIYTNILREVKPTDKVIFVQFGAGHIPILKHLFESNSEFEVIEVEEVLHKMPFENLSFESIAEDSISGVEHWQVGTKEKIDSKETTFSGGKSACLSGAFTSEKLGFFYQQKPFVTDELKRIKLTAKIKCKDVKNGGAGLYIYGRQGWRKKGYKEVISFNGTTGWQTCTIYTWLDKGIDHLRIGGQLTGSGKAWFDDFTVEIVPPSDEPMTKEIEIYLDAFLNLIAENSLHRQTINLEKIASDLKMMCAGAKTYADCYSAMGVVLEHIDKHSFIMPSTRAKEWSGDSGSESIPMIPLTTGHVIDKKYGYIAMPGVNTGDPKVMTLFADSMQQLIASLDHESIEGWVLDLRQNTGGNCWPMMTGIGPILGEGVCGYFDYGEIKSAWYYKDGSSGTDDHVIQSITGRPYTLKKERPRVAVLTGANTGSSGEVITAAFRKRPNTKSFGSATAGYSTGNQNFTLSDETILLLATSIYTDREGEKYGEEIIPDVITKPTIDGKKKDLTLEKALEWLSSFE